MITKQIDNPRDALLYVEFFARFSQDKNLTKQMDGIAAVIRGLMRRVEEQALVNERAEAAK